MPCTFNCTVVVQFLSCIWLFVTPWTTAHQASLSLSISRSFPKFLSIELVMLSNHLIIIHPFLLLPFIFTASVLLSQLFALGGQSVGVLSLASVLPMNIQDWFPLGWFLDLLAVQGTLKSLLQHHSSKASVFWCSAFFITQFSHPYMTTGKTIALARQAFVGKIMSLLFNMLPRLEHRSKHLLIS